MEGIILRAKSNPHVGNDQLHFFLIKKVTSESIKYIDLISRWKVQLTDRFFHWYSNEPKIINHILANPGFISTSQCVYIQNMNNAKTTEKKYHMGNTNEQRNITWSFFFLSQFTNNNSFDNLK